MNCLCRFFFFWILLLSQALSHARAIEVLLQNGDPVPGLEGVTWEIPRSGSAPSSFEFSAVIGGGGHIVGEMGLSGTGVTDDNDNVVYFISPEGESQLLLREGDSAVNILGGSVYGQFSEVFVSDSGEVFVRGLVEIPGEFGIYGYVMRGFPPNLSVIASEGMDYGADREVSFISDLDVNAWGDLVMTGNTQPKDPDQQTFNQNWKHLWRESPAPANEVVRTFKEYPFLPAGRVFEDDSFDDSFVDVSLNDERSILFEGDINNKAGVWFVNSGNAVSTIAMDDEPAPGGGEFDRLDGTSSTLTLGQNEVFSFSGQLKGDGITSDNDRTVFIRDGGGVNRVFQEGDSMAGLDDDTLGFPLVRQFGVLNDYLLQGSVTGGTAYWFVESGIAKPLGLPGTATPFFEGDTFKLIKNGMIGRTGAMAFQSGHDSSSRPAVWATDVEGELQLAAGKSIEVKLLDGTTQTLDGAYLMANTDSDNAGRFPVVLSYRNFPRYIALVDPNEVGVPPDGISGTVWWDVDLSSDFSNQDSGYAGAKVDLFTDDGQGNPSGVSLAEAFTNEDGEYLFFNVQTGQYVVQLTTPKGFNFIADTAEPTDDRLIPVSYTAEDNSPGHDFLISLKPVSISGRVFNDDDNNSDFSDADTGAFEIMVELYADDGQGKPVGPVLQDDLTGPFGDYEFKELATGNYVVVVVVPEGYDFIRDLTNPVDDQCIPVPYVEGELIDGRDFLISKQVDVALKISMQQLNFEGSINLNEGFTDIDSPLDVVSDRIILHRLPEVSQGLVADGVTPLLFKIETFSSEFPDTRRLSATLEDVSGGEIFNGPGLAALGDSDWTADVSDFVFPSATAAWCQLLPIRSDDLGFDDGSNEISATFRITDIVSGNSLVEKEFKLRKPPVTLIHGYNTKGDWGDAYREQLGKTRPVSEDFDNFVITIRYGQTIVEDLGRVLSPIIGGELLDQGRQNTVYTLFYLGRILQQELDEAMGPLHDRWAFNRHDVVAHSQGGLLTRILCSEDPSSAFDQSLFPPQPVRPFQSIENMNRGRFHRVVTIGSPHNGSNLVRYLTALLDGNPQLSTTALIPNVIASLGALSGTVRDKFDPLGNQIRELNDPEGRWKPDPDAKFHLVRTRVNEGMSPSAQSATFGNYMLGLASPGGAIVLPFGSDAVVDFESMGGQAPGQAKAENVFDLATTAEISHSGPVALFSRDRKNPDATGQTNSLIAATHIHEALDNDPNRPTFETKFGPFPLPRLLTAEEMQPIADFAFSREVSVSALVSLSNEQSQSSESPLSTMQVDEDGFYAVGETLDIPLRFTPPAEHTLSGEVTWIAEHYGSEGRVFLYDAILFDENDTTVARFNISDATVGDYVVYAFYYSTEGVQVFSDPFPVASVLPEGRDIVGLEFALPVFEAISSEWIQPFLKAKLSDGSTILKSPYGLEYSNSDNAVVDISNPYLWRAVMPGSSVVTVTSGSFESSATVRVMRPAQQSDVSYEEWLSEYFSEEELGDPLISGFSASIDKDSVGNGLEYIYAQDPRFADSEEALTSQIVDVDGQRFSAVRMKLRNNLGGLSAMIQRSGDLSVWSDFFSIGDALESGFASPLIIDGDYSQEISQFTIRSDQSLDDGAGNQFFRLRVELSEE